MIWPADDPALSATIRRYLKPEFGYESNELDYVKRTDPEAGPGHSQIRDVWGRTRFVAGMNFDARNKYIGILQAFWRVNRGTTFTFFDYDQDYFEKELLGTSTGVVNQIFTINAKEVDPTSIIAYANNVALLPGVLTLLIGTGAEGTDQLQVASGAANGDPITLTYMGRHRYVCEFVEAPKRTSHASGRKRWSSTVREA